MTLSAIATMTHLPFEDITAAKYGKRWIKGSLESYRKCMQYANVRLQKIRLAPCGQLSMLLIAPTTCLKRDLQGIIRQMQYLLVPQRVVSIQFVDEGNVTEVFEKRSEVKKGEYV